MSWMWGEAGEGPGHPLCLLNKRKPWSSWQGWEGQGRTWGDAGGTLAPPGTCYYVSGRRQDRPSALKGPCVSPTTVYARPWPHAGLARLGFCVPTFSGHTSVRVGKRVPCQ